MHILNLECVGAFNSSNFRSICGIPLAGAKCTDNINVFGKNGLFGIGNYRIGIYGSIRTRNGDGHVGKVEHDVVASGFHFPRVSGGSVYTGLEEGYFSGRGNRQFGIFSGCAVAVAVVDFGIPVRTLHGDEGEVTGGGVVARCLDFYILDCEQLGIFCEGQFGSGGCCPVTAGKVTYYINVFGKNGLFGIGVYRIGVYRSFTLDGEGHCFGVEHEGVFAFEGAYPVGRVFTGCSHCDAHNGFGHTVCCGNPAIVVLLAVFKRHDAEFAGLQGGGKGPSAIFSFGHFASFPATGEYGAVKAIAVYRVNGVGFNGIGIYRSFTLDGEGHGGGIEYEGVFAFESAYPVGNVLGCCSHCDTYNSFWITALRGDPFCLLAVSVEFLDTEFTGLQSGGQNPSAVFALVHAAALPATGEYGAVDSVSVNGVYGIGVYGIGIYGSFFTNNGQGHGVGIEYEGEGTCQSAGEVCTIFFQG